MDFKIVFPINAPIYGDNFKEAVKNFVKLNYNMGLNSLILADNDKRYKINMRYYTADTRNRVGFDVYPLSSNLFNTFPPILSNISTNVSDYNFWNPYAPQALMGIPYNLGIPYSLRSGN
jgi:hypothetical protein